MRAIMLAMLMVSTAGTAIAQGDPGVPDVPDVPEAPDPCTEVDCEVPGIPEPPAAPRCEDVILAVEGLVAIVGEALPGVDDLPGEDDVPEVPPELVQAIDDLLEQVPPPPEVPPEATQAVEDALAAVQQAIDEADGDANSELEQLVGALQALLDELSETETPEEADQVLAEVQALVAEHEPEPPEAPETPEPPETPEGPDVPTPPEDPCQADAFAEAQARAQARATLLSTPVIVWTDLNMGPDSGMDADTVDGMQAQDFLDLITAEAATRAAADGELHDRIDGVAADQDADTLDGLDSSSFLRNDDGDQSIDGSLTVARFIRAAQGINTCEAEGAGYSFGGSEVCADTGMFSQGDGDLQLRSDGMRALTIAGTDVFVEGILHGDGSGLTGVSAETITWSGITGVPAGLDDGDDDTQLTEAQVDDFVANNGYAQASALDDKLDVGAKAADADKLDGVASSSFVRNDAGAQSIDGDLGLAGTLDMDRSMAAQGIPDGTGTCMDPPPLAGYTFQNEVCHDTGMYSNGDGDLRLYSDNFLALRAHQDDVTVSGHLSADTFTGDGSGLTSVHAASLDWSDILNRPGGLDDGDDDTQLTETQVDDFVANNGYAQASELDDYLPLAGGRLVGDLTVANTAKIAFDADPFGGSGDQAAIFLENGNPEDPNPDQTDLVIASENDAPGGIEDNIRLRAANTFIECNAGGGSCGNLEVSGDLDVGGTITGKLGAGSVSPAWTGGDSLTVSGTTWNLAASQVWSHNGHLYMRWTPVGWADWLEANALAQRVGGHLATITSAGEQSFIENNTLGADDVAIGYTDARTEGTFEWVTGELGVIGQDSVYANWAVGEPNEVGGEDAGIMYGTANAAPGQWNDGSMSTPLGGALIELSAFTPGS